ncbi:MAG: nucleotide sugar dehydrogenase [Candidatus Bathyarchaeota archaeon]|nr:MAG: nucleotide sugar dehydrogenase [Candidatus Bathyarchaeota archaeon]
MPSVMNIKNEDIENRKKCGNYTISIIECSTYSAFYANLFAKAGFKVVGVSTNPHTLKLLRKGRAPFFSKGGMELRKFQREGDLITTSNPREAASESDIIIISGQPSIDRKGKPDYSLLTKICKDVGMGLQKGSLVIFISSTGPGVIEGRMREILETTSGFKAGRDFGIACSPIQTNSLQRDKKIFASSRIVGANDASSLRAASLVLSKIMPKIITVSGIKAAEAINIFQNLKRETNTALGNELALLCEKFKIDLAEALDVASLDNAFQLPRPGLVRNLTREDFYLIQEEAENVNSNLRLSSLAKKINDDIADYAFRLVRDALKISGKTVRRTKISILGVSNLIDAKETPSPLIRNIINLFKRKVRRVQIYDPFFSQKELLELGIESGKLSSVVEKTDCVVILVGHSKFKRLNLNKIKFLAKKSPALVDISLMLDPAKAEKSGFVYRGLGRGVWTK